MNCENVPTVYENVPTVKEWLAETHVDLDAIDSIKRDFASQSRSLAQLAAKYEKDLKKSHLSLDNQHPEHPEDKDGFTDLSPGQANAEYQRWMEVRKVYSFVEDLFEALGDAKWKLDKLSSTIENFEMPFENFEMPF